MKKLKRIELVELIFRYGTIDGAHHKQWLLDQVLRGLLGDGYSDVMRKENEDRIKNDYAEWDEGIAP